VAITGQRVGYVRVSTLDQNPDRQLDGLRLDRTFTDRASGRDVDRPKLAELLRFVRDGDTIVVHSLDRLGRNLDDLHAGARAELVNRYATVRPFLPMLTEVRCRSERATPVGRCWRRRGRCPSSRGVSGSAGTRSTRRW